MDAINNNVLPPPPNGRDLDVMEKATLGPKRSLRIAIISENFLPKCVPPRICMDRAHVPPRCG